MRIGIDARFFGPQETGIGRYVDRLIYYLQAIDQQNEYVIFIRPAADRWWTPSNPRWRKIVVDIPWYSLAEQIKFPSVLYRANLDLLHVPHFNIPLGYRRPFIVTIHDLILDQYPTEQASTLEPIMFRAKMLGYRSVINHAVRDARTVITVSNHTADRLTERFHIPRGKIVITYEAVDQLAPPAEWDLIRERGVNQPYFLSVGNSYPHKNLERLIMAAAKIHQQGEEVQLVLVGKRDYFSRRLEELTRTKKIDNVLFYGFASDAELTTLYAHASAYYFPSLSEGFGLPGLEAMAAGIPVFAADRSSLPEIYGSAAYYFPPEDAAAMARSMSVALRDTMIRQRLVAAGFEQIKKYNWRTMAEQTLAAYASTNKIS